MKYRMPIMVVKAMNDITDRSFICYNVISKNKQYLGLNEIPGNLFFYTMDKTNVVIFSVL